MSYLVHLRQFEGPLGLLLYLIRKEEMDIFDININEITKQYLDYIRMMKELDLEVAGEFISMAATLIHIKSRMLLPQYNEEGEIVEQEDPRKELVQKLLDYQKYQEAAKQLYDRPLLGRDVFLRGLRENFRDEELGEIIVEGEGLFALISAYRRAMRKAEKLVHKVRPKVQSIAARVMEIKDHLIIGTRVLLRDLVNIGTGEVRTRLLVTFLSMLELGRMGYVSLFQNEVFGDIHIEPKKAIERNVLDRVQEFDAGDAEAIANSIIDDATELAAADNPFADVADSEESPQLSLAAATDMTSEDGSEDAFVEIATDEEILAAEAEIEASERNETSDAGTVAIADADPVNELGESIEGLIDGDSKDGSLEA